MAMGRRGGERQKALFVATARIRAPGHPFYRALDFCRPGYASFS